MDTVYVYLWASGDNAPPKDAERTATRPRSTATRAFCML